MSNVTILQKTSKVHQRLGIIFLHHQIDSVTLNNLESFRRWNPNTPLITVTAGQALKGGFSLRAHPGECDRWKSHTAVPWRLAKSADVLVYLWYPHRRVHCEYWVIVEWDSYCGMPVEDFFSLVADFRFVGPSIRLRNREPEWHWFSQASTLPVELRGYAMGVVPFSFLLVEDALLAEICARAPWGGLGDCNAELRFATLAHACGCPAVAHPLAGWNISWTPLPEDAPVHFGMWHPVKFLVRPSQALSIAERCAAISSKYV
jgi:hypothetical protein